jgi:hypothetical protein
VRSTSHLGVFVSSLVHGIWAGTDTSSPIMIGLYLGAAIVVFSLVAIRITEDMAKTVEASGAARETSGAQRERALDSTDSLRPSSMVDQLDS